MSNSITGRCWTVDTAEALSTTPQWIKAIHFTPNGDEDIITLTDTAGVRIAEIRLSSGASFYQYFGYPGIFGRGVICSALSGSAKAVIYIN